MSESMRIICERLLVLARQHVQEKGQAQQVDTFFIEMFEKALAGDAKSQSQFADEFGAGQFTETLIDDDWGCTLT